MAQTHRSPSAAKPARRVLGASACAIAAGVFVSMAAAGVPEGAPEPDGQGSRDSQFEVASVKISKASPPFRVGVEFLPGGHVHAENAPMPLLLQAVFNSYQIDATRTKGDVWHSLFDIDARAGSTAVPASATSRERDALLSSMLRRLLVDRFKLAYHSERREVPVYALVIAPGGPKLTASPRDRTCAPAEERCGRLPGGPASGLSGIDVSAERLASDLTTWLEREVVDRTGLTGRYDISLPPWSRSLRSTPTGNGAEPPEDPSNPSLPTVVRERLGLQLNAVREPRDVYVIDHVEMPAEN